MQIFLQYCYSAILNIELHCSKYCKKIIIFYLTLSPLSLISRLCLSIAEPNTRNLAPQSTANPTPYHAIEHSENQHDNPQPMIHDPRSTTGAVRVQACHGANEILGFIEVELWNLGFFVCGFCLLMRFWLIYEVLGVWVDGYCWTISPPRRKWRLRRKLQREESFFFFLRNRGKRAENERDERDGREDIMLIYIILFYKYIILISKRGK